MTGLVCVTGRFQPVHAQHLELFEIALNDADGLIVAITNPDLGARHREVTSDHRHRRSANPFTYYERARLLAAALAARGLTERTTIVPFDLTRPEHWPEYVPLHARQLVRAYSDWERHKARLLADAGYPVRVLDGDPEGRLSSSDIRARIEQGAGWEELTPEAVVPVLRALLPHTTKEDRP
ncbi:adenylyltransferase/cytidyltransferase family protein [Pseudonocardia spinosispora]|uniref:adenylyltransferase/cytidyltransferase family protein n=1 Tax=Pseudonocardia spinosispora TaxID=103441 RepID=UPI000428BF15|nr:adenylyltransferase/cytidyltransferase family protein [Pseudonocardia spinosispora]